MVDERRFRYIYCITNIINGKNYYGQRTMRKGYKDPLADLYLGSGKLLKEAYKKYGKENFKKEILISGFFTGEEIDRFEMCAIRFAKLLGKAEYNISLGGQNWASETALSIKQQQASPEFRKSISKKIKDYWDTLSDDDKKIRVQKANETKKLRGYVPNSFKGKHHSEEFKKMISDKAKLLVGEKNGSYGKVWWTNGKENIKSEICPEGFIKGRVLNKKYSSCEEYIESKKKKGRERSFYKCIETGEVLSSKAWYEKGFKDVINVSKNPNNTCKGYHFEKVN